MSISGKSHIDFVKKASPGAVKLACLVSLAARIEPELLRAMRLNHLPGVDAGAEADLWFSSLIQAASPLGLTFRPEVLLELRTELGRKESRHLLEAAWKTLQVVHAFAPPAILLEEKVTYLALMGAPKEVIHGALMPAVAAIRNQNKGGLARWVRRILPRLPEKAQDTKAAQILYWEAGRQQGMPLFLGTPSAETIQEVRQFLATDLERVSVGVRLLNASPQLLWEFSHPPNDQAILIQAIKTQPIFIEIAQQTGSSDQIRKKQIDLSLNNTITIPDFGPSITVRTGIGKAYNIEPPAPATVKTFRVFISSPGDVSKERQLAIKILKELENEPSFEGKIHIEIIAWEKMEVSLPMFPDSRPQEAMLQGLPEPADCDIVIVILWSRMGTPLDDSFEKKEDGTAYKSGTEWEYNNAMKAQKQHGRPTILLYRRMDPPILSPITADYKEKLQQLSLVDDFFRAFTNPDGSLNGFYNEYRFKDFREILSKHVKAIIWKEIKESIYAETEIRVAEAKQPKIAERPRPGTRHNLPSRPYISYGSLIGREKEKKMVMDALGSRYPLISIEGMAGVGKTSLALEVAYSIINRTEEKETQALPTFDFIVWVSANDKPDQKDWLLEVLYAIARVLDFPSITQKSLAKINEIKQDVIDLLRIHLTLIIIDSFETIADPDLENWLRAVPEPSKVLVTSRRRQFQMAFPIDLADLADNDALELIRRHALTFRLDFIHQKPDTELLALVRNTGGNPLAIVWALRNLQGGTLSYEDLIKGLQAGYRNKNITNVIRYLFDTTWKQITPDARKVLFSLPLFAGADSISERALYGASGLSEEDFNQAGSELTEFRLLQIEFDLKGSARYKVHPLTYTFTRVKLDKKPKLEQAARERWSQYYLKFIQDHIVREQPNKRYWNVLVSDHMQAIDEEWPSINAVIKWADEQHQDQLFLDLVMLLVHYLDSRYLNIQRLNYVQKAIDIAHKQHLPEVEALLRLDALGWTYVEENKLDEAYQEIMQGVSIAEQLADDVEAKNDLMALGYAWRARIRILKEHPDEASKLLNNALSTPSSAWIKFRVYMVAGDIALKQNRAAEALAYYQKQAASMKEYGGEGHGYQVLPRLGLAYIGVGDIKKAEEKFKALRDNENIPIGKLYGNYGLALVAYKHNQKAEARHLAMEAKEAIARKITSNLLLNLLDQLFEKIEANDPA